MCGMFMIIDAGRSGGVQGFISFGQQGRLHTQLRCSIAW